MNWLAALLLLPRPSVKAFAATSIVVAPSADGVNVAVYTVELDAAKLLSDPPLTEISPAAKLLVASLDVKVKAMDESLLVAPSLTSELVIAIVGPVVSTTKSAIVSESAFPVASVTVTVLPL